MSGPFKISILAAAFVLFCSGSAHAYLDPGTGSILLQGLIGSVAAGLLVGRLYWQRIKQFLMPRSRPEGGDSFDKPAE